MSNGGIHGKKCHVESQHASALTKDLAEQLAAASLAALSCGPMLGIHARPSLLHRPAFLLQVSAVTHWTYIRAVSSGPLALQVCVDLARALSMVL
jgi:hypothetical protein